jgi:hypothetical protein
MRYYHKFILIFKQSIRYCCHVLIKLEFPLYIFEKSIQIPNFMNIFPLETDLFHAVVHADGRDEINSRFLEFFESA